jgi:hypothetical protein
MFPVCPPPWHFTTWLDLLDHWQTLAAAFLAVVAAAGTIWATTKSATRQFVSTQKQIETSFRLDQRRVGREDLGSGLIDQSQNMTAAAMQIAEK